MTDTSYLMNNDAEGEFLELKLTSKEPSKRTQKCDSSILIAIRKRKLQFAVGFCTLLFGLQYCGGYISGSLALMADSYHMFFDILGYLISLVSIQLAAWPKSNQFSMGYKRLEVIGAALSICLVWILSLGLMMEAIERFRHPEPIQTGYMLGMSLMATAINGTLLFVFGAEMTDNFEITNDRQDMNIRAATLHALGDLLCSIGVIVAAIAISINPDWIWMDPACTLFFSAMAFMTTIPVTRDIAIILAHGTPTDLDYDKLEESNLEITNVIQLSDLHVYALTQQDLVGSVKIVLSPALPISEVQETKLLVEQVFYKFNIERTNIQTDFNIN